MGAGILVGQRLGENHPSLAARATWNTLIIAMTYMAFISLLYVAIPEMFLWGFFAGGNHRSLADPVYHLAVQLLRFVAAYNLLDAMLTVFANAIKGAGDTRFVLRASLCMGCLLATQSWLAVEVFGFGIFGCWAIFTLWIWLLGVIFWWRFRQGKWREMRVIEQVHSPVDSRDDLDVAPVGITG